MARRHFSTSREACCGGRQVADRPSLFETGALRPVPNNTPAAPTLYGMPHLAQHLPLQLTITISVVFHCLDGQAC